MKIVLATNNTGKIEEFRKALHAQSIELFLQSAFNVSDIEETGLSFIENALLKARHAAAISGYPTIADDSGLVVAALNGEPGIYSARYAGKPSNDQANIEKLLEKMREVPPSRRQAYFCCTLVYLRHPSDPVPVVCQKSWHGTILEKPRGERGFGYDPIFFVPTKNCSAAELSIEEKNKISHRGRATRQLVRMLKIISATAH